MGARVGGGPRILWAAVPCPGAGIDPAAGSADRTTVGTGGLGDRRGRVAKRWADLVDLQLDDGALLALLRLEGALLEAPLCHYP